MPRIGLAVPAATIRAADDGIGSIVAAVIVSAVLTIVDAPAVVSGASARKSTRPFEIERVSFASALGIFNTYDCRAAILSRVADQVHVSSAIDPLKTKIGRISGQCIGAFQATKSCRLAGQRSNETRVSAQFYFGNPVHFHFDGAFAPIAAAAGDGRTPACAPKLRRRNSRHEAQGSQQFQRFQSYLTSPTL